MTRSSGMGKFITNHLEDDASFDGCMFETYGAELEFVKSQKPERIKTILDCDGKIVIVSGFRLVNRLGYLILQNTKGYHS